MLDKMHKYEIDPAIIVEDIERTQVDRWRRWNQYAPFQLHWSRGILMT